jgi:ethanolamine utilization protein EutS
MDSIYDALKNDGKARIIQEIVPGKQITLAHIIANPDPVLYTKLGLDPAGDYRTSAIGIITMTPAETAIIAGDIATKSSGAELGFVDRFSGTLIVTGSVSQVTEAVKAVADYAANVLNFTVCPITKT